MKKITRLLSVFMLVFLSVMFAPITQASTFDTSNPYKLMNEVSEQLFARLKADQAKIKANPNHLKTIVEQELMPYVNDQYAALKLLGPNLKGADKNEVRAFIAEFRAYLITTYAQSLVQYTGQNIKIEQEKNIPSDSRIIKVDVDILSPSAPPINVEFTLLKDKKTAQWQAYDMTVEGVGLLSSKQAEWSTLIRQKGLPTVTKNIAQMAKASIVLDDNK